MKKHDEQLEQLKRLSFLNFIVFAATISGIGVLIGVQTQHRTSIGLLVVFLLAAGVGCIPIVYQRSKKRLQQFKKATRKCEK